LLKELKRDISIRRLWGRFRVLAHGNIQVEGIEYDQRAGISLLMNLIVTTTSTNSAESVSTSALVVSSVVNMFVVTDHSNQPQMVFVFSSCLRALNEKISH
jgi:hypothetical protein